MSFSHSVVCHAHCQLVFPTPNGKQKSICQQYVRSSHFFALAAGGWDNLDPLQPQRELAHAIRLAMDENGVKEFIQESLGEQGAVSHAIQSAFTANLKILHSINAEVEAHVHAALRAFLAGPLDDTIEKGQIRVSIRHTQGDKAFPFRKVVPDIINYANGGSVVGPKWPIQTTFSRWPIACTNLAYEPL